MNCVLLIFKNRLNTSFAKRWDMPYGKFHFLLYFCSGIGVVLFKTYLEKRKRYACLVV